MPLPTGIQNWSTTAATNASADSSINYAEGQAPSTVNDSARAMMARVKELYNDIGGVATGGSSTAYTLTTGRVFTTAALMSGSLICFIPHTTSGAAPTLAVDGLTARAINFSTGVAVATGALKSGTPYLVTYIHASTEFIIVGALAVNAASVTLVSIDITGGTALTAPAVDDELAIYDLSATANRKITLANFFKAIGLLTAETAPATDDGLALFDTSAGTADFITLANALKVVNALTEDTTPDLSNDFLLTYDASASAVKKVKPTNLKSGVVLLTSGTASSVATLEIPLTSYTAYRGIRILLSGFRPVTDDVELWMRFSTDGGSNYDSGANTYGWGVATFLGSAQVGLDTKIVLAGSSTASQSVGNATTEGANVEITILNQTSTAFWTRAHIMTSWVDAEAGQIQWGGSGAGFRRAAQDTDAVQFLFESGNIAEGNYAVYGLL